MPTAAIAQWVTPLVAWRAAQCLLAVGVVALVTVGALQVEPEPPGTVAALLYLMVIVLLATNGSFVSAALVSLVAVVCLQYFFYPPLYSLSISEPLEAIAVVVFLTTSLVITTLVARLRNSVQGLRRQAALLDLTHDMVFVRDTKDVITYWNRGAQEQYGWSAQDAVGNVTHELLQTEFPLPLEEITAELHRTGRWEGEVTHSRRDGSKLQVASRWALQRDSKDLPIATLETNNDITARKRAEDALLRTQADLAHITRVTTLGELAASIAHEVNQPLAAIIADANAALNWLALSEPDLGKVREALRAIVKDSERAAEVLVRVRGLLARSPHSPEPCDVRGLIEETLALMRAELTHHGIRVHTAIAVDLPRVMGDCIQLQQVLLNLLMNAADALKEVAPERRRLIVRADVERGGQGTHVVVAVRDAGNGIREADVERIFEAFYSTKPSGLGMGLSISRSLIERHGGRLWASPNSDHGATFQFALPALP
jgi:two-component system sensor kinase FixL